jgi:VIT1/CCC1 family predicted Fe2+/Mn2+ transporter
MDQLSSDQTGPTVPRSSIIGRLANVYATPGEVFDQVKASPRCILNWLVPCLILLLVGWLGTRFALSQAVIKQQLRDYEEQGVQRLVDKGRIPKEQADAAQEAGQTSLNVRITSEPLYNAIAVPFLWAVLFWLVGTVPLKGNFTYLKALEVVGLASMITVLGSVVRTLLILITGNFFASPGLMLVVKDFDPQNTLHSVLAAINIMTFWGLAVKAIGLARLSGASFGKAVIWVFVLWGAWTALLITVSAGARIAYGG